MRLDGWEKRHKDIVQFHADQPAKYGVSDCYTFAEDNVFALTGSYMFPDVRKKSKYSTPNAALKLLIKHGFENVEQAFASIFPECHPSAAMRGDIGVIEQNGEICGGVFTALGFAVRNDERLYYFSASEVKTAFKVGRE